LELTGDEEFFISSDSYLEKVEIGDTVIMFDRSIFILFVPINPRYPLCIFESNFPDCYYDSLSEVIININERTIIEDEEKIKTYLASTSAERRIISEQVKIDHQTLVKE